MKKVLLIIGTRPEAVKMAPVWQAFAKMPEIKARICVTAQHRQMLDQVLAVFRITPDYDLNIMKRSQTLFDITAEALRGVGTVIDDAHPDLVLVHGDTSTAFAAALAAFYRHVPIGHVEAGLRTNDKYSPFPEEMNRQLVDRLSDLFFAPTAVSRDNLLAENVPPEKIYVTGNTVIDALSTTVRKDYSHPELEHIGPGERFILLTAHRRENLGEPLRRIFRAVRRLTEDMSELRVIYPVHLNPLVRSAADEILAGCRQIKMIEPLSVLDFHNFMARADLILTDSGGVQEEAPSLGKPVLVLRGTTERPEGISAGTLKLVGTDEERIYRETLRLLTDPDAYAAMSRAVNPYGDGHASERIAQIVASL
ncbi:MAG: UDP-N-acetylglucosamine 2-epimerase (non-hydrolyzing) [Clostridia bacterium]|nr:UDP-N-acetylglucosamine 2-epimerase (non-hydrolyzing) [Clostridia bacterium]